LFSPAGNVATTLCTEPACDQLDSVSGVAALSMVTCVVLPLPGPPKFVPSMTTCVSAALGTTDVIIG
jgi:hypothetical protein